MAKSDKNTKTSAEPWPRAVCDALLAVIANRRDCKGELEDLVKYRNSVKGQLAEMGSKKTPERLDLDHEYVKTIMSIDQQRARLQWLTDRTEEIIIDGDQGKLFVDDEIQTNITAATALKRAKAKADEKAAAIVPCVGGTYTFKHKDRGSVSGCVTGGNAQRCTIEVDDADDYRPVDKDKTVDRGDRLDVDWPACEIVEIDVPKDALRVDQPQISIAAEMGKGKKSAA